MRQYSRFMLLLLLYTNNAADTDHTFPPLNDLGLRRTGSRCFNNRCADMTYSEILKRYHGMFYTKKELRKMAMTRPRSQKTRNVQRKKRDDDEDNPSFEGDLDKCCPTLNTLLVRSALRNINGELRYVVNLLDRVPPMIQFIPQGKCMGGNGQCTDCKQQKRLQTLLVVDPTTRPPCVTFDMFYINAYCFCSNL